MFYFFSAGVNMVPDANSYTRPRSHQSLLILLALAPAPGNISSSPPQFSLLKIHLALGHKIHHPTSRALLSSSSSHPILLGLGLKEIIVLLQRYFLTLILTSIVYLYPSTASESLKGDIICVFKKNLLHCQIHLLFSHMYTWANLLQCSYLRTSGLVFLQISQLHLQDKLMLSRQLQHTRMSLKKDFKLVL